MLRSQDSVHEPIYKLLVSVNLEEIATNEVETLHIPQSRLVNRDRSEDTEEFTV